MLCSGVLLRHARPRAHVEVVQMARFGATQYRPLLGPAQCHLIEGEEKIHTGSFLFGWLFCVVFFLDYYTLLEFQFFAGQRAGTRLPRSLGLRAPFEMGTSWWDHNSIMEWILRGHARALPYPVRISIIIKCVQRRRREQFLLGKLLKSAAEQFLLRKIWKSRTLGGS